jgi:hypothetical protein
MKYLIILAIILFTLPYAIARFCYEYNECIFGIVTYDLYAIIEFLLIVVVAVLVYKIGKKLIKK